MTTSIEWTPPIGPVVAWRTGLDAVFRLLALDGIGPVGVTPQTVKSPGQPGETAVDTAVPGRVVTLSGLLQAADREALWTIRAQLAASLAAQPIREGQTQQLGRLRIARGDQAPLELVAMARSAATAAPAGSVGILPHDVEWYCPDPWWREVDDSSFTLEQAGAGLAFPVVFPLAIPSNNVEQDVENAGDVDAPVLARLYGDCTTARLRNLTYGETIEIGGNIPAGAYIEISTAFGDKRVEEVTIATGERAPAMDRLNLALADFWQLRPGSNRIRFEATTNVSGRAQLIWRQRYAGI
ncbi:MAG TPA: hypothetical protein VM305_01995 [Candidatus Limnocylindrales bacterium]|nr:hypothetical protein [Candidatus Limnocylindrales bacterium]